jgi:hypothetical protein
MLASAPSQLAQWVVIVVFGCLCGIFLIRAFQTPERSRRFSWLSMAFGCLVLVRPESASGLVPADDRVLFRIIGCARVLVGLIGVVLGGLALRARLTDRGSGVVGPIIGILLSMLHGTVGAYYLVLTSAGFAPPDANSPTAWTYKIPNTDLEIRLPSDNWKEGKSKNGKTAFAHRLPQMLVVIYEVKTGQNENDYQASDRQFRNILQKTAKTSDGQFREGVNAVGHSYVLFTGTEETPGGNMKIYLAMCRVWCREKGIVVHLMFEGTQRASSDLGQESEMKTFRESAEAIMLSVR